jgi:replicative DNA helicase
MDLAQDSEAKDEESTVQELIPIAIDQIETWHSAQGVISGVSTGFTDLDKMTTGFHEGEMIVIAGRPSLGKTSLAMNIAEHVAVDQGFPVGVFSLEMTKLSLMVRMICSRARVNVRNIQQGFLSHYDFPKLTIAAGRLNHANIYINDQSGLSILGLRTRARRMHQQHGIRLLVIDYLQLMSAERSKNDSREQEVSFISKGVKGIAKELGIPVIAISQLNRGIEKDKERRPRMSDLRESGSLEQDADFVGILWKPARDSDEEDRDAVAVNLEICKQRNGPTGTVPLTFLRQFTRFESACKVDTSDDSGYHAPYSDQEPTPEPQAEMPI